MLSEWEFDINFSNPNRHVPNIERENRVLQERFRVGLYCLLFKVIPRVMICALALRVTKHWNYFPDPTGISKHYLTATILSKKVVDCKKELVHCFGDYVQANFESNPKNNNVSRTLD